LSPNTPIEIGGIGLLGCLSLKNTQKTNGIGKTEQLQPRTTNGFHTTTKPLLSEIVMSQASFLHHISDCISKQAPGDWRDFQFLLID
jgi:hypothetical protein